MTRMFITVQVDDGLPQASLLLTTAIWIAQPAGIILAAHISYDLKVVARSSSLFLIARVLEPIYTTHNDSHLV